MGTRTSMGGPCKILVPGATKKTPGPACTDNFQVAEFDYAGRHWYSVEQCYQGMKWTDDASIDAFAALKPHADESDFDYGQRTWRFGQRSNGHMHLDWEQIKLRVMY